MIMMRQVEKVSSRLLVISKLDVTEIRERESNISNKHELKEGNRIYIAFVVLFDK